MTERIPYGLLLGIALVLVAAAGVAVGLLVGEGWAGGSIRVVRAVADDLYGRADGLLTEDEARCTAERLAAGLGRERVTELGGAGDDPDGLRIDEMTEDERRVFATASYGCLDDDHLVRHLQEMWLPFADATPDEQLCFSGGLVEGIGPDRARDILVAIFLDPSSDLHDLIEEPERSVVDDLEANCFETWSRS